MKNTKKLFFIIISLVLLVFSPLFTINPSAATVTPTVFVHGYNGGFETFDTMISQFASKGKTIKSMKITISKTGKLSYSKPVIDNNKNPLVQIYFENGTASFDDQMVWLSAAMKEISKIFKTSQVNIVAHSMGGVISTKYLIATNYKNSPYPKADKFVTLASPILGCTWFASPNPAAKDLQPYSTAIKSLYNQRNSFPSNVKVYSLYGSVLDNTVANSSATGLTNFTKNIKTEGYKFVTHTSIHDNKDVINAVYKFLAY